MVEIIEERLNEITAPFLNRLTALHQQLTPQEIKAASMVREGRSSAEISEVLLVSTAAVAFHRKQITDQKEARYDRHRQKPAFISAVSARSNRRGLT